MRFKDKYLFASALFLLLLYSTVAVSALERDLSLQSIDSAVREKLQKESGVVVGNYHALIIGIGDYSDRRIPDLNTPVSDATSIANVLSKNYGFSEIKLLLDNDANNSKIIRELRRLATVSKEDDSVLIYYAGHGELDNITGSGWWVPYNATASDSSTYINNAIIQQYVKAIPARHVLIVADSCFSGTLLGETRDLPPIIDNKFYASLFKERSRWGMTSGNLTPVEDSGFKGHSVFAYQFIRTLQNNEKPYLTPREIYQKIAPIIRNNSEQMPVTKPIRNTNDQGGEFVFIRMAAPGFVPQMTEQDQPESVKPTSKLDPEEEMWLLVKDSNDKNDIIMFLNLYPSGKFRNHARLKLSKLRKKEKEPARPELPKLPGKEKMASLTQDMGKVLGGTRSSDGRYIDHGDGTITDTKTGLLWTKKDSYADLGKCLDWNASKSYVSNLATGGHRDWRLPTVKELKSIYEKSKSNVLAYDHDLNIPLHLDSIFADGAAYVFWSSETVSGSFARNVTFINGDVNGYNRVNCVNLGVRAVRR